MIYKKSWKYILFRDDYYFCIKYKYYRLKSLKDFSDVKKGDFGGYIRCYRNLSQFGDCWIYDNATVVDNAQVLENAKVYKDSTVRGYTKVYGNAIVTDYTVVCGGAKVHDNAKIYGHAEISGEARICGRAYIRDCILSKGIHWK